MEIGVVGLPNVGKSTLFNALTGASAAVENFPFTTVDPNVGVVSIPDPRLALLEQVYHPQKLTAATLRVVDIAGLIQGASQGAGLGNQFLSHIRAVDAVALIVRCFADLQVSHVLGEVNPVRDVDIVLTELLLADLQQAERACEKVRGAARSGDEIAQQTLRTLEQAIQGFNAGTPARRLSLPPETLAPFQFLTAKPLLIIANLAEGDLSQGVPAPLRERAAREGAEIVPVSAKLEAEMAELSPEERRSFREALGVATSGVDAVLQAIQRTLGLIPFFTVVGTEVRAWMIPKGTSASQAAGKIHSDMERGFIRAEVFAVQDLARFGSERALRDQGLVRVEGRDYPVRDGDVLTIAFSH
ncbi:MAG: redox-regulated ATPase YchF [Elusimicrobia bacterium]|nr:redox-regulated ATPase YchF [Elusimicrobiota bacterium]